MKSHVAVAVVVLFVLTTGCSSDDDSDPTDGTMPVEMPDPAPTDDDATDGDPIDDPLPMLNADNYVDAVSTLVRLGFGDFTRDYRLFQLTDPFTSATNALLDAEMITEDLDVTTDCDDGGTVRSTGSIFFSADYDLTHVFDECSALPTVLNGTVSYQFTAGGSVQRDDSYDIDVSDAKIGSEARDLTIDGSFVSDDGQGLQLTADFDVRQYRERTASSDTIVSGSGELSAATSADTQDATGSTADSNLVADMQLSMNVASGGDGNGRLTATAAIDFGLASSADLEVGPPVRGTLVLTAADGSGVLIIPADTVGIVDVTLTDNASNQVTDTRAWEDFL